MRISEIHIYQHDLPVVGGVYRTARTSIASFDATIIEIVTEKGMVGYGETCPHGPVYQPHHAAGARAALRQIGPHLIGLNALGIDCVRDAMDAMLSGHRYAKAAGIMMADDGVANINWVFKSSPSQRKGRMIESGSS